MEKAACRSNNLDLMRLYFVYLILSETYFIQGVKCIKYSIGYSMLFEQMYEL